MRSGKKAVGFFRNIAVGMALGVPCGMALPPALRPAEIRQLADEVASIYDSNCTELPKVLTGRSAILWWHLELQSSGIEWNELPTLRRPRSIDFVTGDPSWTQGPKTINVISENSHVVVNLWPYHPSGYPREDGRVDYAQSTSMVGQLANIWVMSLRSMIDLSRKKRRDMQTELEKLTQQATRGADLPSGPDDAVLDRVIRDLEVISDVISDLEFDINVLERMDNTYRRLTRRMTLDQIEHAIGARGFGKDETTITHFFMARLRSSLQQSYPGERRAETSTRSAVARRLNLGEENEDSMTTPERDQRRDDWWR